jgi:SAM-dependent methyltransferase
MEKNVLARRSLPEEYREWNRRWGAPYGNTGRAARMIRSRIPSLVDRFPKLGGPFAFQANSETRIYEYPWAFFAAPVECGISVVEIGGGLSGFQFVLSKSGARVINVDPGESASGIGWPCDRATIARLNRAFGTDVRLENTTLAEAQLADESVDRVYSISTIEHIPVSEDRALASEIRRVLRPGGKVVLTIDLFLNLVPFTAREKNRYGWNIDVSAFVGALGFEKIFGDERELNGYPSFDAQYVLSELSELLYGTYPACAQLLILEKP